MTTFMGIDISQGSPLSQRDARYSVVVIDEEGRLVHKQEDVSVYRLIRLAWEFKPKIIALDNIYELGGTEKDFAKIVSMLPMESEVVQTTFDGTTFRDIRDIAKNNGIEVQGKPNSSKTAYINAQLALKGVGTRVKLVEEKTKVLVSRGKNYGPGGMSSNRFKRKTRVLVLRAARQVKESLDAHGFDYDMIIRRSKSGLEGAVFMVYAPRSSLFGIVKKFKGHDVTIDIKPIYKSKIEFIHRKEKKDRPLIVGVDPGIAVGVSAIDIYGRPVILMKRKSMDREDVIEVLLKYGTPVVISTDVNPVPDTVKKIASQLGVRLYIPERTMSVEDKMRLVQEYSERYKVKVESTHIRDSLAAAIRAYNDMEKKIRQVDGYIRRYGLDIELDKVASCVIRGETISVCVEREIERLTGQMQNLMRNEGRKPQSVHKNEGAIEIEYLKREIFRLRTLLNKTFNDKIMLERQIAQVRNEIKLEVERDREVYALRRELESKTKMNHEALLKVDELTKQNQTLLRVIRQILSKEVSVIREGDDGIVTLKDGIPYFRDQRIDPSVSCLIDKDIMIISNRTLNEFKILDQELMIEKERNTKLDIDELSRIFSDYKKNRKQGLIKT